MITNKAEQAKKDEEILLLKEAIILQAQDNFEEEINRIEKIKSELKKALKGKELVIDPEILEHNKLSQFQHSFL